MVRKMGRSEPQPDRVRCPFPDPLLKRSDVEVDGDALVLTDRKDPLN
jgi:hypothetical protein